MSVLAPWLSHPKAVSQRLHTARDKAGLYQCKTRRGKLVVLHHSLNRAIPETIKTTVKVFDSHDPDDLHIIELARQDPRYAIAAALEIDSKDIWLEDTKPQPRMMHLAPRGVGGSSD